MIYTPENITHLQPNQVFVYGSNRSGIHGAGAARQALTFGAQYGKTGLVGQTYGLSTKDEKIQTLPISEIKKEVESFLQIVKQNLHLHFLVTKVGTGLAGFKTNEIAPLFKDFLNLENVSLPKEFYDSIIYHGRNK